jgi:hypothetical protein
MTRLRGHFDGRGVVLDEAPPAELKPNTPVEVLVVDDERRQAIDAFLKFMKELWSRPLPADFRPSGQRNWKREDLYERGGKPLS